MGKEKAKGRSASRKEVRKKIAPVVSRVKRPREKNPQEESGFSISVHIDPFSNLLDLEPQKPAKEYLSPARKGTKK